MPVEVTEFGKEYLACPDMFPGRISGDVVGTKSVTIAFLGTEYCFRGLSESQYAMLQNNYGKLCVNSHNRSTVESVVSLVYQANRGDFVTLHRSNGIYSFDLRHYPDSVQIAGPEFMARFNRIAPMMGGLWLGQDDNELEKLAFENYFRLLVSYRLLSQGGVLLHSAGIVQADAAFLFVGHSGAGKSTISKMSADRGLQVLSDDLNAFVKTENGYLAGKLPFSGSFERNMVSDSSYPVAFLGYLCQGNQNVIDHNGLTIAEMVSKMYANSPFVNADPYCEEQLYSNISGIIQEHQMALVEFDLSGGIWTKLVSEPNHHEPRCANNE